MDGAAKTKLREQALKWLKVELDQWRKVLMVADEEQRSLAIKALNNWQKDSDLASVHDILWVERLSEEEQLEWRQLWQSVHDLKGKAEEGN